MGDIGRFAVDCVRRDRRHERCIGLGGEVDVHRGGFTTPQAIGILGRQVIPGGDAVYKVVRC